MTDRSLDRHEIAMLEHLQRDASMSVAELAERVGLSQTPCWNRLKRLERDGVIERRVALLDRAALGLGLTGYVLVKAARHDAAWLESFARAVRALPEILECHRMAGETDYLLKVVLRDIGAYDALYRRLIAQVEVSDVTAIFAMETIKETTELPIDAPRRPAGTRR